MRLVVVATSLLIALAPVTAASAEWKATKVYTDAETVSHKPQYRSTNGTRSLSACAEDPSGFAFQPFCGRPLSDINLDTARTVIETCQYKHRIWSDPDTGHKAIKFCPSLTIRLEENGREHTAWYGDSISQQKNFLGKTTSRYPHGVFGEKKEPIAIVISSPTAPKAKFRFLPKNQVFEDRQPRLTDLDGFGKTHIVTILTEVTQGASVAVFGIENNELTLLAQTPYIGTPNRWLNIAGIADFDGSGSSSIALVETPHIGGTLQFWRWETGNDGKPALRLTAEAPGFSNHEFGSREQRLSAVEDFDNDGVDDLAVPSFDRRSLKLVKLSGRKEPTVEIMAEVALPAAIDKAIGVSRQGDDVVLTVGLEDGSVWAVHR